MLAKATKSLEMQQHYCRRAISPVALLVVVVLAVVLRCKGHMNSLTLDTSEMSFAAGLRDCGGRGCRSRSAGRRDLRRGREARGRATVVVVTVVVDA